MRALVALAMAIVVVGVGRAAAETNAADRAAFVRTIEQQLDAFRADDGPTAFSFASPGIQSLFGSPDRFMEMVRSGYRAVYRPRSAQFLGAVETPRGPVQRVLFVGPDGRPVIAEYHMERQPDGTWRIDGVILTEVDDGAV